MFKASYTFFTARGMFHKWNNQGHTNYWRSHYVLSSVSLSLSRRHNPLWVCIHSPLAGFSLLFQGFYITHNDAPQSVGLLRTSDQFVAETSTWQHTTLTTDKLPCPGGIRTHDLSRREALDLRLRPRGYWDRLLRPYI